MEGGAPHGLLEGSSHRRLKLEVPEGAAGNQQTWLTASEILDPSRSKEATGAAAQSSPGKELRERGARGEQPSCGASALPSPPSPTPPPPPSSSSRASGKLCKPLNHIY